MPDFSGAPAVFRGGVAQVVITPPLGCSLAGYFHERIAESVRDDLHAKAMVLESQGERIALVSCDLVCLTTDIAEQSKELIESEVGIAPDHVLLCATHTHTGPEPRSNSWVPQATEWVAGLPRLIAKAVAEAASKTVPVTLRLGRAEAEGYAWNRLLRLKDGQEVFGKAGREDQVLGTAGPIDPELQTLSLVDESSRVRGMLVNFALHPDVIGGGSANFISADWPGEVGKNLATIYGDDVVTLFLQGTCGDINHCTHVPTFLPTRGPDKAVQLGRGIAGVAMHAAERAEPMTDTTFSADISVIDIPYYTRDARHWAEVEALRKKEKLNDFERFTISLTESWQYDNEIAKVPIHVIRLGELALVGFPAEIFARLGLELKQWSPAGQTMVIELANVRVSNYVPTTDQAERGAYGAKPILSRWLCADAGRRMIDQALVMLQRKW